MHCLTLWGLLHFGLNGHFIVPINKCFGQVYVVVAYFYVTMYISFYVERNLSSIFLFKLIQLLLFYSS
ncbi:hypothetical protein RIF29_41439 [Crotalaria pallida]|uniref:Uncharacterized protein n=1 Tax=Crotalaria pallida TaxID=3830 RepID=A0AAN9HPD3_CROPI